MNGGRPSPSASGSNKIRLGRPGRSPFNSFGMNKVVECFGIPPPNKRGKPTKPRGQFARNRKRDVSKAVIPGRFSVYFWPIYMYVLAISPFAALIIWNKPLPVWLSTAGHCSCGLPPHPPDCHTVHHWAGVLERPRL